MSTELDYPFEKPTASGQIKEVADGIFWIELPLPFALNHINVYALRDNDGWTVIDTGIYTPEVQALWEKLSGEAYDNRKVGRVIVTHFHPDHIGNAGWFKENYGAELCMAQEEWLMGRLLATDNTEETMVSNANFYRQCDFAEEVTSELLKRGFQYSKAVDLIPRQFFRLCDGDTITIDGRDWEIIVGHGHSPEHVCLYSEELKILFSGDQILPRITPIIGVYPMEPDANPLFRFLESLKKFNRVHPDTLVLPSHGLPFRGVHARIEKTSDHHQKRLDMLHEACDTPHTVLQATKVLFKREFDAQTARMAATETLAHLNLLRRQGLMEKSERDDGVWLFRSL